MPILFVVRRIDVVSIPGLVSPASFFARRVSSSDAHMIGALVLSATVRRMVAPYVETARLKKLLLGRKTSKFAYFGAYGGPSVGTFISGGAE